MYAYIHTYIETEANKQTNMHIVSHASYEYNACHRHISLINYSHEHVGVKHEQHNTTRDRYRPMRDRDRERERDVIK